MAWMHASSAAPWRFRPTAVAVLGAGAKGARIAALFANAGFQVFLYDSAVHHVRQNHVIEEAIQGVLRLQPSPFLDPSIASAVIPANYESALAQLQRCDLVIETLAERLEWKVELFKKIAPHLPFQAVLATTTHLNIQELADALPKGLRERFLGLHFFQSLPACALLELIPTHDTAAGLVDAVETFFTQLLGQRVLRARDTPLFIADRLGVFALLSVLHQAEMFDLRFDLVDALTGNLLGRSTSATFRTLDALGLDVFARLVESLAQALPDDPWAHYFVIPAWMKNLIERGCLGQKTGAGLYKRDGENWLVLDVKENSYQKITAQPYRELMTKLQKKSRSESLKQLIGYKHPEAEFLWACLRDVWQYAAYHLMDMAETVRDVDMALRWGFGWEQGPFELWQSIGVKTITTALQKDKTALKERGQVVLPTWLIEPPLKAFYMNNTAYNPTAGCYQPLRQLPVYARQAFIRERQGVIRPEDLRYEDEFVEMWAHEEVYVVSFKTKGACINEGVLHGMQQALAIAVKEADGLVLWQRNGKHFSVGADLHEFAARIDAGAFERLANTLAGFQQLCLGLARAPIPVVAALQGAVYGGGCELALHCDARIAQVHTQMGLVEARVGLLPAGGGCTWWLRQAQAWSQVAQVPLNSFLPPIFERLSRGMATQHAFEAKSWGYLQPHDTIIMHPDELLHVACAQVKFLKTAGYLPPRAVLLPALGANGVHMLLGSDKNQGVGATPVTGNALIGREIAGILCPTTTTEWVEEALVLQKEREGFIALAQQPYARACIAAALK